MLSSNPTFPEFNFLSIPFPQKSVIEYSLWTVTFDNFAVISNTFFGHIGKLIKVAGGIFNTKHAVADGRREIMVAHAALCGAGQNDLQRLFDSKTTDDMMDILNELNISVEVSNSIADAIRDRCMQRFDLDLNVILVDMEGNYLNDNWSYPY